MALTARQRANLPPSQFAYPARRAYPINTPARARNALARAAQSGTSGSYRTVERAVNRRFPNIQTRNNRSNSRRR